MSANLDYKKDGKAAMIYVGATPWHKEGTKLETAATSKDAMELAGFDYTVEKQPIYLADKREVPDKFATVRTDRSKDAILGIVGSKYEVVQNWECFSFFDSIVGEGKAIYQTAGVIDNGRKIWLMAKLPNDIKVGDEDVNKNLLLCASHDGSIPIICKFTPIRVVCQNTLNAAINNHTGKEVRIRHSKSADVKLKEAHRLLGISVEKFDITEQVFNAMTKLNMTDGEFEKYLETVFPTNPNAETVTRVQNVRDTVTDLFEGRARGADTKAFRGTLWGAYNSVTEYVDYGRGLNRTNSRVDAIIFGSGASIRDRAFQAATQLLNA